MIQNVSVKLHHIEKIILIAHRDCGAYGGSVAFASPEAEKEAQTKDLQAARRILFERFPKITVRIFYAEINGENVEFQVIE